MGTQTTFTVPAGLHRVDEIIALKRRLHASGKNVQIQAYDTVQGLQWNGGRLLFNKEYTAGNVEKGYAPLTIYELPEAVARVKRLNEEGIPFNLTFNNTLEGLDVEDEDGNYLLKNLHNGMNGVTVATESLRRHVAENYPEYEITASICFAYKRLEQYAEACGRYHKVVLMPTFAYEPDKLRTLPLDKLVFIMNDECFLFCPRKDHYDNISRCNLSGHNTRQEQAMNASQGRCLGSVRSYVEKNRRESDPAFIARINGIRNQQLAEDHIDPGDIQHLFTITPAARRELIRMGLSTFKLQGRDYLNDAYAQKVAEFLEKIVREEL